MWNNQSRLLQGSTWFAQPVSAERKECLVNVKMYADMACPWSRLRTTYQSEEGVASRPSVVSENGELCGIERRG